MSYLRRMANIFLTAISEAEKIASEAINEVGDITEKIAKDVQETKK